MKKGIPIITASLSLMFIFALSLMAQEKTEVSVMIKQDGKVVKDTTYQFEDEEEAKHAMQMMELISGAEKHGEHYNYTMAHSGEGHSKAMVFISEDGETTEIKHIDGDSLVWVSEDGDAHGEHVVIMKSGNGESFDILIDEDEEGKVVKKEVKVIVADGEEGSWTVKSDDLHEAHENVFISDDDENVKVIIIKKDGDHDCEHDHDEDHDGDHDVEVEKEVKVIVKKKEKE